MSSLVTIILILVLISGGAITPIAVDVAIGDSITPKDGLLWSIEKLGEAEREILILSNEDKINFKLSILEERLDEASKCIDEPELLEECINECKSIVNTVSNLIVKVMEPKVYEGRLNRAKEKVNSLSIMLDKLRSKTGITKSHTPFTTFTTMTEVTKVPHSYLKIVYVSLPGTKMLREGETIKITIIVDVGSPVKKGQVKMVIYEDTGDILTQVSKPVTEGEFRITFEKVITIPKDKNARKLHVKILLLDENEKALEEVGFSRNIMPTLYGSYGLIYRGGEFYSLELPSGRIVKFTDKGKWVRVSKEIHGWELPGRLKLIYDSKKDVFYLLTGEGIYRVYPSGKEELIVDGNFWGLALGTDGKLYTYTVEFYGGRAYPVKLIAIDPSSGKREKIPIENYIHYIRNEPILSALPLPSKGPSYDMVFASDGKLYELSSILVRANFVKPGMGLGTYSLLATGFYEPYPGQFMAIDDDNIYIVNNPLFSQGAISEISKIKYPCITVYSVKKDRVIGYIEIPQNIIIKGITVVGDKLYLLAIDAKTYYCKIISVSKTPNGKLNPKISSVEPIELHMSNHPSTCIILTLKGTFHPIPANNIITYGGKLLIPISGNASHLKVVVPWKHALEPGRWYYGLYGLLGTVSYIPSASVKVAINSKSSSHYVKGIPAGSLKFPKIPKENEKGDISYMDVAFNDWLIFRLPEKGIMITPEGMVKVSSGIFLYNVRVIGGQRFEYKSNNKVYHQIWIINVKEYVPSQLTLILYEDEKIEAQCGGIKVTSEKEEVSYTTTTTTTSNVTTQPQKPKEREKVQVNVKVEKPPNEKDYSSPVVTFSFKPLGPVISKKIKKVVVEVPVTKKGKHQPCVVDKSPTGEDVPLPLTRHHLIRGNIANKNGRTVMRFTMNPNLIPKGVTKWIHGWFTVRLASIITQFTYNTHKGKGVVIHYPSGVDPRIVHAIEYAVIKSINKYRSMGFRVPQKEIHVMICSTSGEWFGFTPKHRMSDYWWIYLNYYKCQQYTVMYGDLGPWKTTVAHEVFHIVQFITEDHYNRNIPQWVKEATASWAENVVFSESLGRGYRFYYVEYVVNGVNDPTKHLMGQTFIDKWQCDPHYYTARVFIKFLEKKKPGIIREYFEVYMPQGLSFKEALKRMGYDLKELYKEFAEAFWRQDMSKIDHANEWDLSGNLNTLNLKVNTITLTYEVNLPSLTSHAFKIKIHRMIDDFRVRVKHGNVDLYTIICKDLGNKVVNVNVKKYPSSIIGKGETVFVFTRQSWRNLDEARIILINLDNKECTIKITIERARIRQVTPNFGSVKGGYIVTIKGENIGEMKRGPYKASLWVYSYKVPEKNIKKWSNNLIVFVMPKFPKDTTPKEVKIYVKTWDNIETNKLTFKFTDTEQTSLILNLSISIIILGITLRLSKERETT